MRKAVLHAQKVRRFGQDCQMNGTLCGRVASGDEMNIAVPEQGEQVTCKLCLKRLFFNHQQGSQP